MNYIELINSFWQMNKEHSFTANETQLYFKLLDTCNSLGWKNPFNHSNGYICGELGISEPTLLRCRNKLQQVGLITFISGKVKREKTVYELLGLKNFTLSDTQSSTLSDTQSSTLISEKPLDNTKHKLDKTKQNNLSKSHSVGKPPAKKKDSVLYWQVLVDDWFVFYEKEFKAKPTFDGVSSRSLKTIVDGLKKMSEQKKIEWTEDIARRTFQKFLSNAWADTWMQNNFLLKNLNSHFDSITNKKNADGKSGQSANGKVPYSFDLDRAIEAAQSGGS